MIPFGVSVSDFIAVVELVHEVGKALKESAGSRSRFLRLIDELEHLEQTLQTISRLTAPQGFEDQLTVIKIAAARCEGVILAFLYKNSKFHTVFESTESQKWWRSPLKKVEWQMYKQDDVEQTYSSLQSYTAMLGLLLNAFHINYAYSSQKSWAQTMTALVNHVDSIDNRQKTISGSLQTLLEAATGARTKHEEQFAKIIELLNTILEFQALSFQMPPQVLREQPVYFSDAHGRLTTFDLSFIASKDAFIYVLKDRFDMLGAKRIEKGQYALQDGRTKRDINQNKAWKMWFRPGQRVDMSMVFEDASRETNSCPRCECENKGALDTEVQCSFCGMIFKRIEAVDDIEIFPARTWKDQDTSQRISKHPRRRPQGRNNTFTDNDIDFDAEFSDDDLENTEIEGDEPSIYSRVRLMLKKLIKWDPLMCSFHLEIASDGLKVKYVGPRGTSGYLDGCAVLANKPLSLTSSQSSLEYFEIKVISGGVRNAVCIGFSKRSVNLNMLPGLNDGSIAYHGDDGRAFDSCFSVDIYGPKFGTGDTVGCGVTEGGSLGYFTKNGRHLGFFEIRRVMNGSLYPTVGMEEGVEVQANFGASPFRFNYRVRLRQTKKLIINIHQKKDLTYETRENTSPAPNSFTVVRSGRRLIFNT